MQKYDPAQIEPKWQKIWGESGLYKTPDPIGNNKNYCLVMFPYPSGDLHTGHWYNFGPADTMARFARMQGQAVLHPMGFDAFGLPAENAAIKRGIPPAQWTDQNIASMIKQLKMMGPMYDWDRLIDTSKPEYYHWTQWLFVQLFNSGLAYRAKGLQNWCPKDQTVLANEQVVGPHNVCDRCGTPVIKKELEQWFFKITDYADRLLADLDKVVWPERVKTMQQNWIGRSEGAAITFQVDQASAEIEIFTTRPDTLFGATYMVLAPEHPLVSRITTAEQKAAVGAYQKQAARETELDRLEQSHEKTGVFTGAYALNPINGEKLPIWIADYVLMSYGTGAIMAVPAHDERDYEFAKKFDLPIKIVIEPVTGTPHADEEFRQSIVALVKNPKTGKVLSINWGKANGGNIFIGGGRDEDEDIVAAARREVAEETGYTKLKLLGQSERIHHHYIAHSKGSKQRYIHAWGVYFELEDETQVKPQLETDEQDKFQVEWLSVAEADKRVRDELHRYVMNKFLHDAPYTGSGILVDSGQFTSLTSEEAKPSMVKWLYDQGLGRGTTQYRLRDWLISRQRYWGAPIPIIYCEDCGVVPVPPDQLPVELPLDVEFTPTGRSPLAERPDFYETTCPRCDKPARRETDTMDTFVDSSWYFLRYPNTHYDKGPFDPQALAQWAPVDQYIGGVEHAILHLLYARFMTKFLYDQKLITFDEPFKRLFNQGIILGPDGQKMSKSRGNVVNPDDLVEQYGADTFRMYLMFMGPYDQGGPFNLSGVGGVNRFLYRVWQLTQDYLATESHSSIQAPPETQLATIMHKLIKKVTHDLENFNFNTAIAGLMESLNQLTKLRADKAFASDQAAWHEALSVYIRLLAPFAPHLAEELWHQLGETESVHRQTWPTYNPALIKDDVATIVIQINGKVRANLVLPIAATAAELEVAALAEPTIKRHLEGRAVIKTIVVPRKIVNFVVKTA